MSHSGAHIKIWIGRTLDPKSSAAHLFVWEVISHTYSCFVPCVKLSNVSIFGLAIKVLFWTIHIQALKWTWAIQERTLNLHLFSLNNCARPHIWSWSFYINYLLQTASAQHTKIFDIASHPTAKGHGLRSINMSHGTVLIPNPAIWPCTWS